MGIIDRFEEEYLDVSSSHASVRELLELLVGAVLFVVGASALAYYLLGQQLLDVGRGRTRRHLCDHAGLTGLLGRYRPRGLRGVVDGWALAARSRPHSAVL